MPGGMAWIRKQYGVPAKRGGRVRYTGGRELQLGTILGTFGQYLNVRLDGEKYGVRLHPIWELEYLIDVTMP